MRPHVGRRPAFRSAGIALAVAEKDARILLRDPQAFTTLFLMPLVFLVVLTFALGRAWGSGTGGTIVQQSVPAWTLFGVFFIVGPLSASIHEERRSGTAQRLAASPVSPASLLLGKLLPFLLTNLVQIVALFAIGAYLMPLLGAPRLDLSGRLPALLVVAVSASLAATALGLLVAAVARTAEQASGYGTLAVLTMSALGGIMVPRAVMPPVMKSLGLLTPHAWALEAFRDVLIRSVSAVEVVPAAGVLLLFAGVFCAGSLLAGRVASRVR